METIDLDFAAKACLGRLVKGSPAVPVERVCTDSRQARAGDLFFAIKGGRFDGHDFIPAVAQNGATAVVVENSRVPADLPDCAVMAVDDVRQAFGRLAAVYRNLFDLPVVAVAGSNGKTTTKELIAAVLRQKFSTLWSEASFNNDIGVPLTLLRLEKTHRAAVFEVGTNHPGELAPLLRLIRPQYGVLTNIGREHLEFFGDIGGVAAEEGWVAEVLPADGTLFVNGDDEWCDRIGQRTRATTVRVGLGERNDWCARSIRTTTKGVTFRVDAPRAEYSGEYRIRLLGRHQVLNALLAVAVGERLGLDQAEIQRGLAECQPPKMRLQLWDNGDIRILDDSYNANADSMLAALQVLMDLPCKGRRVAVLGDMAELGAQAEAAHAEVGRRVAELGVGQLFAVGKMAAGIARSAREAGLTRVIEFADVEGAAAALKTLLKPGDVVLLKASRATGLERIVNALRDERTGRN